MRTNSLVAVFITAGCIMMAENALAKTPVALIGKAFFTTEALNSRSEDALVRQFTGAKPRATLTRGKNERWEVTVVAFFRKPSIPGPMTIWLYDKADKAAIKAKEPVHIKSVEAKEATIFIHELQIDPDYGFNKGQTVFLQIGQIVNKRPMIYATGELMLQGT